MLSLQSFFYEGRAVRTAGTPDDPVFVAADVCAALDIANSRDALASLDPDEKGVVTADTPGGAQEMAVVNEPGLYSLIYRSRKPEAKAFKRWLSHEVLPAIRKTGRYETPADSPDLADLFRDPLITAQRLQDTITLYVEAETARRDAERQLADQAPAVEFARKVELSPVDINIGTFAKAIGWGPNKLHAELRRRGYLFRRDGHPVPKQRFVEAGLFTVKEVPKGDRVFPVTSITGKGQLRIASELGVAPLPSLQLVGGPERLRE